MAPVTRSREIRLRSRPAGRPAPENFELAEVALPPPAPGEVQVRNQWMSVDPYMRRRMTTQKSYVPPFAIGEALGGGAVGTVVASNGAELKPGDLVQSMLGWREAFNAPAATLHKLPSFALPPEAYLGVAGMPGLTAHVGLLQVAELAAGDVLFVSAASGAVGSVACQIARIKGATVIGSAGGAEKCDFVRTLGVGHVIDYKAEPDLKAALRQAAPDGIDVYFDNVGGAHLEAALDSAKTFARFALCGMISQYSDDPPPGPANIGWVVARSLRLQGFIVSNYLDRMAGFVTEMAGWIQAGEVRWRQTVDEGIESAPGAFIKLFTGENFGKMLVKLA